MDKILALTHLIASPTLETIYMVLFSTLFATLLGFPLGVALVVTEKGGLLENETIYRTLDSIVNICRSFPFIILMIVLFPLSRIIVGTTIGTTASIVPLSIGAAPFVGRVVESSLKEVEKGLVEAAVSMGTHPKDIILKVMIPEALPSLILGETLTIINIIGYSAMAGAIGGGGLGDLAIRYGFHRFQTDVLVAAVIVIILLVQVIQGAGNKIAQHVARHR
ncbi:MAG: methionine ABC transporter permease [Aminobacterium sp.]|uniref:methionine ABC transporter permease n=1 Tax=Aminobacterium sp. MB27-C1 TaxID=3070661 RepID=UPI001BCB4F68|nr:methionine ABC transporter permease [Aminobacterium sp. MB27-C1]MDD2207589.1 ABC transporter permease [Aminobacterium sp.]MDD4229561.1 ABC transporter permease [Aminobacterium sp.]WMI71712.1 methionine ABC transporter permease [Aminobacterium sp. MB27-C1]